MLDTETMSSIAETQESSRMQARIEDCLNCHSICLETITYCLEQGGQHADAEHILLLMDCAEICQTSANFMLRVSSFNQYTCDICAEICEECAEDCAQFSGDEQMQACADMCRRCAASCQEMAEQMP